MYRLSRDKQSIEQILMKTVHSLDARRAAQVLDFARWLQTQPDADEAEEKAWEAAYLQNKDDFRAIRITRKYRALGILRGETMVRFWIGKHDTYNRLLR